MSKDTDLRTAKSAYDTAVDRLLENVTSNKAYVRSLCLEVLAKVTPLERAYLNAADKEELEKAEALRQTSAELAAHTHFFVTTILSFVERQP